MKKSEIDEKTLIEVYLKMYEQQLEYARHHEEQRTTITNLIMVLTAAVSAIVVFDEKIIWSDLPLTIFIIVLGTMGVIFSAKHFERSEMHGRKSLNHRNAIDLLLPKAKELFKDEKVVWLENNEVANLKSDNLRAESQEVDLKNKSDSIETFVNRQVILSSLADYPLASLSLGTDEQYKKDFPFAYGEKSIFTFLSGKLHKGALYKMWVFFHFTIIVFGIILTIMALIGIAK